jgi:molybdopterin-guanine dinucleotide biosynthesis protein A
VSPTTAAIVLAGGRSTRMGREKATLDWHGSTLLRRAVGIVGRCVDGPVVVVCAAGQSLPPLPPGVELATDEREARGPLQGIAAGLHALADRAEVVFVTGVDAPLLHPALVAHVIASLHAVDDVALPHAHGFPHPLAAAYRAATIAPLVAEQLAHDRLGTRPLFARCRVRRLDEAALLADAAVAKHDPHLRSLHNLNAPAEYAAAHDLPEPLVILDGRGTIRAATLARAGGGDGGGGAATINGRPASDPQEPLVDGDRVALSAAMA